MPATVLFLQTKTATPSREKLAGAYRYIESAGWNVQLVEANPKTGEVRKTLRRWSPVGCIVDCGIARGRNPVRLFHGIPTVYFDQDPDNAAHGQWYVRHDSTTTVRLAFNELIRSAPVHFAFVRDARGTYWSREREAAFRKLAVGARRGFSSVGEEANLGSWLRALPKPCGILTASDFIARKVLDAARKADIAVPDDLRVVGINNDAFLCEHTRPTLTSVHPDFEGGGYLAMAMLHRLVRGTTAHPSTVLFGPKGIARRGSTRIFARADARVSRALDFIRLHFNDPSLTTDRIAVAMGCSRRLADLRFREITGHTILSEIRTLRLDAARRLLSDPSHDLAVIPELCGYRSTTTFMRMFKSETGLTMGEYRRRKNRAGNPTSR